MFAIAAAVVAVPAAPAMADPAPAPCAADQLVVTASGTEGGVGHRALSLMFALADGAAPCTLRGYPGVDSGGGSHSIHARPTLRGYLGGLPSTVTTPPTVTVSPSHRAQSVVEGTAVDATGNACTAYTDLTVNPPGTIATVTVPATIDACDLQVHPVTDAPVEPGA